MKLDDFLGSLFASGWAILMILSLLLMAPFDLLRVTFEIVFHGLYRGHVAEAYVLWGKVFIAAVWTWYDLAIGKMSYAHAEEIWRKLIDHLEHK